MKFLGKFTQQHLDLFQDQEILLYSRGANFFGQTSKGLSQVRGNGVLILTKDELYFALYMPKQQIHIPISSISSIETTKWHLKKSRGHELLKISFSNDQNQPDSIAWLVSDLQKWVEVLSNLVR